MEYVEEKVVAKSLGIAWEKLQFPPPPPTQPALPAYGFVFLYSLLEARLCAPSIYLVEFIHRSTCREQRAEATPFGAEAPTL